MQNLDFKTTYLECLLHDVKTVWNNTLEAVFMDFYISWLHTGHYIWVNDETLVFLFCPYFFPGLRGFSSHEQTNKKKNLNER